jgi:hypothetical protein
MSDGPPNITTLESMGILLWHLEQQMTRMESQQHRDIQGLKDTIATLASKAYVDERLGTLRDEVQRNKPGTLMRNVAALLGMITLFGAVVALVVEAVRSYDGRPGVAAK